MSLESILQKIRSEAQAERDRILDESRERAEKLKADAALELESQVDQLLRDAEQASELEAHRLVTQARLRKKLRLLELKKSLVDDVLEKAFELQTADAPQLMRQIVRKDGITEEPLDQAALRQELRPQLESYIASLLKL
jgi:vacuolar-type H+-ATPase subunit H